jgi:hypothetical protein
VSEPTGIVGAAVSGFLAAFFAFVARDQGEWGWWIPAALFAFACVYFLGEVVTA